MWRPPEVQAFHSWPAKNKVTTRWEGPQSLSYHKKDKSVTSLHPDLTPVCMSPIAQQHNHINKPHAQLYPTKLLNSNQINSITHHNHSITNHKRMYAVTHFTKNTSHLRWSFGGGNKNFMFGFQANFHHRATTHFSVPTWLKRGTGIMI